MAGVFRLRRHPARSRSAALGVAAAAGHVLVTRRHAPRAAYEQRYHPKIKGGRFAAFTAAFVRRGSPRRHAPEEAFRPNRHPLLRRLFTLTSAARGQHAYPRQHAPNIYDLPPARRLERRYGAFGVAAAAVAQTLWNRRHAPLAVFARVQRPIKRLGFVLTSLARGQHAYPRRHAPAFARLRQPLKRLGFVLTAAFAPATRISVRRHAPQFESRRRLLIRRLFTLTSSARGQHSYPRRHAPLRAFLRALRLYERRAPVIGVIGAPGQTAWRRPPVRARFERPLAVVQRLRCFVIGVAAPAAAGQTAWPRPRPVAPFIRPRPISQAVRRFIGGVAATVVGQLWPRQAQMAPFERPDITRRAPRRFFVGTATFTQPWPRHAQAAPFIRHAAIRQALRRFVATFAPLQVWARLRGAPRGAFERRDRLQKRGGVFTQQQRFYSSWPQRRHANWQIFVPPFPRFRPGTPLNAPPAFVVVGQTLARRQQPLHATFLRRFPPIEQRDHLRGFGGVIAALVPSPTAPGLEYTALENRLHYGAHENRTHFTVGRNRLHYTAREED